MSAGESSEVVFAEFTDGAVEGVEASEDGVLAETAIFLNYPPQRVRYTLGDIKRFIASAEGLGATEDLVLDEVVLALTIRHR